MVSTTPTAKNTPTTDAPSWASSTFSDCPGSSWYQASLAASAVGDSVGCLDGRAVGANVFVGSADGTLVGGFVGAGEGAPVGGWVGSLVGGRVGNAVGRSDGVLVG